MLICRDVGRTLCLKTEAQRTIAPNACAYNEIACSAALRCILKFTISVKKACMSGAFLKSIPLFLKICSIASAFQFLAQLRFRLMILLSFVDIAAR